MLYQCEIEAANRLLGATGAAAKTRLEPIDLLPNYVERGEALGLFKTFTSLDASMPFRDFALLVQQEFVSRLGIEVTNEVHELGGHEVPKVHLLLPRKRGQPSTRTGFQGKQELETSPWTTSLSTTPLGRFLVGPDATISTPTFHSGETGNRVVRFGEPLLL